VLCVQLRLGCLCLSLLLLNGELHFRARHRGEIDEWQHGAVGSVMVQRARRRVQRGGSVRCRWQGNVKRRMKRRD